MADVIEDAAKAAEWVSGALESSGYKTDFSPRSLAEIERFFVEHTRDGAPTPGGLLSSNLGSRIFAIGAYIGEVIIRSKSGRWQSFGGPSEEIDIEVVLPDGTRLWPVQRAMKRLKNGPEDSIVAYGASLRVER